MGLHDAVPGLGSVTYTPGKFGNALTGAPGGLTVPYNLSSPTGTIEAWVKTTATGAIRVAVGNSDAAIWIGVHSSGVARAGHAATSIITAVPINDGTWHHLALCITGTQYTFFVDGNLVQTNASTIQMVLTAGIGIGQYSPTPGAIAAWDGQIDEVRISSGVRYTANFAPSTTAFAVDSITTALYHLETDGADSVVAAPVTNFAPNDAQIVYSPANWDVSSVRAKTINPGAYFRCAVAGSATGIVLKFDMTGVSSPVPILKYRVDDGGWQRAPVAATVALAIPNTNAWSEHTIEVVVAATSEFVNRWNPQNAHVSFTGMAVTAPGDAALKTVTKAGRTIFVFGDSIVEAYKSLLDVTTPDGSDSTVGWAYQLGQLLGAEVGCIGFGGTRWIGSGQGGVPSLATSYANLWGSGPARSFSAPVPDVIVVSLGHNDGATDNSAIIPVIQAFLANLLAATPISTQVVVMRPFSGRQATPVQTAVQNMATNRVKYVDTTGWWSASEALDGVHPTGYVNTRTIAPKAAAAIRAATNQRRYVNVGGTFVPKAGVRI
jgi:lysophospholipase L1-like esterase